MRVSVVLAVEVAATRGPHAFLGEQKQTED